MTFVRAWPKGVLVLTIFLVPFLWEPLSPEASRLTDTVTNLHEGGGISPPPPSHPFARHAPYFVPSTRNSLDAFHMPFALPFDLLTLKSTGSGFTPGMGQGVLAGSVENLSTLHSKGLTTRDSGKSDMAFPYTRLGFAHLEGKGLNNRSPVLRHEALNNGGLLSRTDPILFEFDLVQMDFDPGNEENVFLSSTFGLTHTWAVAVVIPIFTVHARALPQATIVSNNSIRKFVHNFGSGSDSGGSMAGREEPRIGDIILQTQYNFPWKEPRWPEFAILGQVGLPTGDKEDFLGTGETNLLAVLTGSWSFGRLTPSINLGFEWTTEGPEQNNVSHGVGLNAQAHSTLTFALDLLGRWEPNGDGI
jgi:hypothetical protein